MRRINNPQNQRGKLKSLPLFNSYENEIEVRFIAALIKIKHSCVVMMYEGFYLLCVVVQVIKQTSLVPKKSSA